MLFLTHTAQKYYESSINLAIKIFGTENHDDVASSVQSLGYLFFLKEDYVNAQKSFERALKIHTALQNDNSQSDFSLSLCHTLTLHFVTVSLAEVTLCF
jgi:uncharacterized protein HemY